MGLREIVISAVAVGAVVCAYADVKWRVYADCYPDEYGVVGWNAKNQYSGDVVVPPLDYRANLNNGSEIANRCFGLWTTKTASIASLKRRRATTRRPLPRSRRAKSRAIGSGMCSRS